MMIAVESEDDEKALARVAMILDQTLKNDGNTSRQGDRAVDVKNGCAAIAEYSRIGGVV